MSRLNEKHDYQITTQEEVETWKYYDNENTFPAFTFEDILNTENARLIWGEETQEKYYSCHRCGDRGLVSPHFADESEFIKFHAEAILKDILYANHKWDGFDVDSQNIVKAGYGRMSEKLFKMYQTSGDWQQYIINYLKKK